MLDLAKDLNKHGTNEAILPEEGLQKILPAGILGHCRGEKQYCRKGGTSQLRSRSCCRIYQPENLLLTQMAQNGSYNYGALPAVSA